MCSCRSTRTLLPVGFPIRKSSDQCSVGSSPRLIAASYVLHRLLMPRHPPFAPKNLTTKDAHVHCAVLKIRSFPITNGHLINYIISLTGNRSVEVWFYPSPQGPTARHHLFKSTSQCSTYELSEVKTSLAFTSLMMRSRSLERR